MKSKNSLQKFFSFGEIKRGFVSLIIAGAMCAPLLAQTEPTVYVCGMDGDGYASYWKNGEKVRLSNYGSLYSGANSIAVSDNGDVYVAGVEKITYQNDKTKTITIPKLWKNGVAIPIATHAQALFSEFYDSTVNPVSLGSAYLGTSFLTDIPAYYFSYFNYSIPNSVFVSNGKVYMTGSMETGFQIQKTLRYWDYIHYYPLAKIIEDYFEYGFFYCSDYCSYDFDFYGEPKAVIWTVDGCYFASNDRNGMVYSIDNETNQGLYGRGNSIFVSGNDVYVAGMEACGSCSRHLIFDGIAKLWKNGESVPLTQASRDTISSAQSVFVSNSGDVYVLILETYMGNNPYNNDIYRYNLKLWKNGDVTCLAKDSVSSGSIFVSGNDVYVLGGYGYWKNGVRVKFSAPGSKFNSFFVSGNDVYVAGQKGGSAFGGNAAYWKNGQEVILSAGSYGIATGIFVTPGSPTGIKDVPNSNPLHAWVENGVLHVSGLTAGEQWSVYNVAGGLIYQGVAGETQCIASLPGRGVYIVKSGNNTVKAVY